MGVIFVKLSCWPTLKEYYLNNKRNRILDLLIDFAEKISLSMNDVFYG